MLVSITIIIRNKLPIKSEIISCNNFDQITTYVCSHQKKFKRENMPIL